MCSRMNRGLGKESKAMKKLESYIYHKEDAGVIYLGDCLSILPLLPENSVNLVLTDPPYNVGKQYERHTDDKQDTEQYMTWLNMRLSMLFNVCATTTRIYISHTDTGIFWLKPMLEADGWIFHQLLVWYGPNLVGGAKISKDWNLLSEPILLFRKGKRTPMIRNMECNAASVQICTRPQTNFSEGRYHVAQKPLQLYRNLISRTPGNIVIDPFLGSGTTAVAAKQLGRRFIGIEIEEKYCEIAKQRLSQGVLEL